MPDEKLPENNDKLAVVCPENKDKLAMADPNKPQSAMIVKRPGEDIEIEMSRLVPGAGQIELTDAQKQALYAPIDEDTIEIRPDGLIYWPWQEYATKMREAFGLNWAMIPKGEPKLGPNRESILWGFYLIIQGKLAGYAIGEQAYKQNNATMNWSDACEGAKSNALMRLCKGIGIGLELWRPSFIRKWKKTHTVSYKDGGRTLWKLAEGEGGSSGEGELHDSRAPMVAPDGKNGPSTDVGEVLDAEVVSQSSTETGTTGLFDQAGPIEEEETELFDEGQRDPVIQAIKESLKAEKIDESDFRKWLFGYQITMNPSRQFVGRQGQSIRFHMGNLADLKYLHGKLSECIKKYRSYQKKG